MLPDKFCGVDARSLLLPSRRAFGGDLRYMNPNDSGMLIMQDLTTASPYSGTRSRRTQTPDLMFKRNNMRFPVDVVSSPASPLTAFANGWMQAGLYRKYCDVQVAASRLKFIY